MKQILLIISLVFSINTFVGQQYVPMLGNLNEWKFTTCNFGCITDNYFTDGDTLVNGTSYKILDGYHYISRGFLLREDASERKVYIKIFLPTGVEDHLLYDFSLGIGDTFEMMNPITPFPSNGGEFVLDSIVSRELYDSNSYRHFYFSPAPGNTVSTENAVWIEGLGSLSIVTAPGGHPNINGVGHVSCFFKNGEKIYENLDSITECTPSILSILDIKNDITNVKAFYKDQTLQLLNLNPVREVSVYNLSGKLLFQSDCSGEKIMTVDGSLWRSGIYFVQFRGRDNSVKTEKFLVN